jgi:hypothetical protein
MCNVLYREGAAWAVDSIRQLQNSAGKGDQYRQLINYLERGKTNKPADFVRGVESVIDQVKKVAA